MPSFSESESLNSMIQTHNAIHDAVREMGRNVALGENGRLGSAYGSLAGAEMVGLGGIFTSAGGYAILEGGIAGTLTGGSFVILGGEIVWLGVDFMAGIAEGHVDSSNANQKSTDQ